MELETEKFCQACINGDAPLVRVMLIGNSKLANALGMVRADHREFMKKNNSEAGWSALHLAAHYGQLEIVKALIEAGASLIALSENREANTPLMAAVAGGNIAVVSLMLQAGADPLKTDASGKFHALKLAEVDKKPEIAALLRDSVARLHK